MAARVGAIVVEDDCESELRYDGATLPVAESSRANSRVIYISTFSKVLFPGLRTGYVVVPDHRRAAPRRSGGGRPAAGRPWSNVPSP